VVVVVVKVVVADSPQGVHVVVMLGGALAALWWPGPDSSSLLLCPVVVVVGVASLFSLFFLSALFGLCSLYRPIVSIDVTILFYLNMKRTMHDLEKKEWWRESRRHSVFSLIFRIYTVLHLCPFASKLAALLKRNSGNHFILLLSKFIRQHHPHVLAADTPPDGTKHFPDDQIELPHFRTFHLQTLLFPTDTVSSEAP
jgi:hypothetical protein